MTCRPLTSWRLLRLEAACLAVCLSLPPSRGSDAPAAMPSPTPTPSNEEVVSLPQVTVEAESYKNYPFFRKDEVALPNFAENSPPIDLFYPGKATVQGVTEGFATIGVMLDADGKPTDFLILRYTQPYFAQSLLREAHEQLYAPRRVKGVAVPGRFDFGYRFVPTMTIQLDLFADMQQRYDEIQGGPRFIYEPHLERDIDGGGLVPTKSAVAFIPDGYEAPKGKPVRVLVSFYVDEQGHVRLPSVESAASALLIPNAVKAVGHWEFKPPTLRGQPVLVFTMWSIKFVDFDVVRTAAPDGSRR